MADENLNYAQAPSLDEMVFEHRNKEYGAYELRKDYPKYLTKSFIIGTLVFVIGVLSPLIYATIKNLVNPPKKEVKAELINILDEQPIIEQPKDEPPPPPPPKEEPPKQEVIQNVVPEPKREPKIETPPPPITEQLKTTTGLENQEGVKNPTYAPPPPPSTKGATAEVVSTTEVYESVDQNAEFKGGIDSFRRKVQNNFDTSVMEGDEGKVSTVVIFVVERDGTITDVKANGSNKAFNEEAIRTIKSIKDKWAPGKKNGQEVRSRFRFPISMVFEG